MCKCRMIIWKIIIIRLKTQNCFSALDRNNQSQFKYAAILLMLMALAAWEYLFVLSCPISFHCSVSPSNCKILSRLLWSHSSQPPAQNITTYQLPAQCLMLLSILTWDDDPVVDTRSTQHRPGGWKRSSVDPGRGSGTEQLRGVYGGGADSTLDCTTITVRVQSRASAGD